MQKWHLPGWHNLCTVFVETQLHFRWAIFKKNPFRKFLFGLWKKKFGVKIVFGKFFSKIDKNKNILVKGLRRDADPPKVPKLGTQWAKSTPRHPGRNPKRTQLKSKPPKNDILRISTEHQHLTPAQTHTQITVRIFEFFRAFYNFKVGGTLHASAPPHTGRGGGYGPKIVERALLYESPLSLCTSH